MKTYDTPCNDKTCHYGANVRWNYQFADGPCLSPDCKWPNGLPPRKHFTDNPPKLVIEDGRHSWRWGQWDG
jgi:hypothetical protein